MGSNYVNAFNRSLPLRANGLNREHSLLYKFLEKCRSQAAYLYHLPRDAYRTFRHHSLQFSRRWLAESTQCIERHNSNCGRHHPFSSLPKDDLPTSLRPKRNITSRWGAIHCPPSDPTRCWPSSISRGDDLCPPRAKQPSYDQRDHDRVVSFVNHPSALPFPEKNSRLERNHGSRETDGIDSSSYLDSDVPQWRKRIHGHQSYALVVSYFGRDYYGWQKTRSGPSIQEELEKALAKVLQESVHCEAASRTDRGVHATGQVVQFSTSKTPTPDKLQKCLNGTLPKSIRIVDVKAARDDFHPTLDAKSKIYHYYICQSPIQDLFQRDNSWHYPHPLDLEKMKDAANGLLGTHDFTRFTTEIPKNPICTLYKIEFTQLTENRLQIALTGDRFLYKMARRLSGTLANIGAGKIPTKEVGMTAPPHGLFLYKINYAQ